MNFLTFVGMGNWMDLEKEFRNRDRIVCDEYGVRVLEIKINVVLGKYCVYYNQGYFDYLSEVERVDPLILELL